MQSFDQSHAFFSLGTWIIMAGRVPSCIGITSILPNIIYISIFLSMSHHTSNYSNFELIRLAHSENIYLYINRPFVWFCLRGFRGAITDVKLAWSPGTCSLSLAYKWAFCLSVEAAGSLGEGQSKRTTCVIAVCRTHQFEPLCQFVYIVRGVAGEAWQEAGGGEVNAIDLL